MKVQQLLFSYRVIMKNLVAYLDVIEVWLLVPGSIINLVVILSYKEKNNVINEVIVLIASYISFHVV